MKAASDPHGATPVVTAGLPPAQARAAAILVHGRGATAESILSLSLNLGIGEVAYLAPQAHGSTWYPASFLAPLKVNEPGISSGLKKLERLVRGLETQGIPPQQILLLGFSQGACLALEFAARHPRKYGGVVGFTGGLIGPPGTVRDYPGSLQGTPAFLGSGDPDLHVPWQRVQESAEVLEAMGAEVSLRRYPGMGHTINPQEIDAARQMLEILL